MSAMVVMTAEELEALVDRVVRRCVQATARPELVSIEEAAEVAGVSVSTIRRRVRTREIPSSRVGRQIRIDVRDLAPREAEVVDLAARARGTR